MRIFSFEKRTSEKTFIKKTKITLLKKLQILVEKKKFFPTNPRAFSLMP